MFWLETPDGHRRVPFWRALALVLLPVLVAGSFLAATWGATHRLHRVEAAVVNLDHAVTVQNQITPLGRQLTAELVDSAREQNVTWVLADAATAEEGLRSGRFAVVVTIPESFSADAMSFATGATPRHAHVTVVQSEVADVIDPGIASVIAHEATTRLNTFLTTGYLSKLYEGFSTTGKQLQAVSDAAGKLADGNTQLASGLDQAKEGTRVYVDGIASASKGASQLSHGVQQYTQGVDQFSAGTHQLGSGADRLAAGAQKLSGGAGDLVQGASRLSDGATKLGDGVAAYSSGVGQYVDGVNRYSQAIAPLVEGAQKVGDGGVGLAAAVQKIQQTLASFATQDGAHAFATSTVMPAVETQASQTKAAITRQVLQRAGGGAGVTVPAPTQQQLAAHLSPSATPSAKDCAALGITDPATCQGVLEAMGRYYQAGVSDGAKAMGGYVAEVMPGQAQAGMTSLVSATVDAAFDGGLEMGTTAGVMAVGKAYDTALATKDPATGRTLVDGAAALKQGASQLAAGAAQATAAGAQLRDGGAKLTASGGQLVDGAHGVATGAQTLGAGASALSTGAQDVSTGAARLATGLDQVVAGADKLAAGGPALRDGASTLSAGLSTAASRGPELTDGTEKLATAAHQLADGSTKLADGLSQGAKMPSYTPEQREALSDVVAAPVEPTAYADLFQERQQWPLWWVVAALWLGALATYLVVRPVPRRAAFTNDRPAMTVVRSLVPGLAIVGAQGLALWFLTVLTVGPSLGRAVAVLAVLLLGAAVLALVNHALVAWFGGAGRWVSVVLLLLPLAASLTGAAPGWLQALAGVSPASPAVQATRLVLGGGTGVTGQVLALLGWFVVAVVAAAAAALRGRRATVADVA